MAVVAERHSSRRRLAAFVVALVLLVSGVAIWYAFIRPMSWPEVLERDRWSAEEVRDLEGTITDITIINTSYGPQTFLELQSPRYPCETAALGDPNATYRVGGTFRTIMHFREFRIGGVPAVWAPEVACPFPTLWTSFGVVMDAVSLVMGNLFTFVETDAQGWTTYEIFTRNGDTFPADRVSLNLREEPLEDLFPGTRLDSAAKLIVAAAAEYVSLTGGYRPEWEIDAMASLADGASPGGRLRFEDVNGDGRVGDQDRIQVRLDPTGANYQPYLLTLGAGMTGEPSVTSGTKYILQGPRGPYEWQPDDSNFRVIQLVDVQETMGQTATTIFAVGRATRPNPGSLGEFQLSLTLDGTEELRGPLAGGPLVSPTGVRLEYSDDTADGLLNDGDRFVASGLPIESNADLDIDRQGVSVAQISWFPGYGHVGGNLPDVQLGVFGTNPYTIVANVTHWHPEFAFGKSLTVSLFDGPAAILDHVPLSPGILGTWSNGSLAFLDRDGDGAWSTGDEFALQGVAGARYRVEASVLFDTRTYAVDAGT